MRVGEENLRVETDFRQKHILSGYSTFMNVVKRLFDPHRCAVFLNGLGVGYRTQTSRVLRLLPS